MNEQEQKFPEGHFTGLWTGFGIAIGLGLGVPIALVLGNMAFVGTGLPLGIAIGIAIGAAKEARYKAEGKIRPLNESEKKQQKVRMYTGLSLFILGLLLFVMLFMLK
jgi:hypothetical protein